MDVKKTKTIYTENQIPKEGALLENNWVEAYLISFKFIFNRGTSASN